MLRWRYPSDLTDAQWARLEPLLPAVRPGGRPRAHALREIIDALRYVLRGGIAWRALPHDYPPWRTVYHYFRAWRWEGTWERLNDDLRELVLEQMPEGVADVFWSPIDLLFRKSRRRPRQKTCARCLRAATRRADSAGDDRDPLLTPVLCLAVCGGVILREPL